MITDGTYHVPPPTNLDIHHKYSILVRYDYIYIMTEEHHNPEEFTVQEACEYLGLSAEELRDKVSTEKLVPVSIQENGDPLFSRHSIDTLLREEETFLPKRESESPDHAEEEDFNPNQPIETPAIVRNRIVILGRRRAGKTVFLSRLYHMCWNATPDQNLHMRAQGSAHKKLLVDSWQKMKNKKWPDATLGETYSEITITRNARETQAIVLDYPGEVFRRAFVDEKEDGPARELLAHVDRAAAVILLIDPGVALSNNYDEHIDDDYGLVNAVRRIIESSGGSVPIAVVLTKCDQKKQKEMVREWSKETGLKHKKGVSDRNVLLKELYANLMRVLQENDCHKTYSSSAVHTNMNSRGEEVPSLEKPPKNVMEPIAWCVDEMRKAEESRLEDARLAKDAVAAATHHDLIAKIAERDKKKANQDEFFKIIKYSLLAAAITIVFSLLIALMLGVV